MSRQGSRVSGGRAGGGVRPQPSEDLQICDQAGAQPLTRAPVHHCAQGDLHPQVLTARTGKHITYVIQSTSKSKHQIKFVRPSLFLGSPAAADQVVSGPY